MNKDNAGTENHGLIGPVALTTPAMKMAHGALLLMEKLDHGEPSLIMHNK